MAGAERLICASSALCDGGDAVRFEVVRGGRRMPAFVVRYRGDVFAYLNRCAHVPVELDWQPGRIFDLTGQYLLCSMHGAHYEVRSGRCVMGPCVGALLVRLSVHEHDGQVWMSEVPA